MGTCRGSFDSVTFEIPGRLPGTNEISWHDRSHWRKGHAFRIQNIRLVSQWIIVHRVPFYCVPVGITVTFFEKDFKRDCDNVFGGLKFLLDALTQTGRIQNDSRKWVETCVPMMGPNDREHPRIEVTIRPIPPYSHATGEVCRLVQQAPVKRAVSARELKRKAMARWSKRTSP